MVLIGPLSEKLKIVSQIFLLLHFKRRFCCILLQKILTRPGVKYMEPSTSTITLPSCKYKYKYKY